MSFPKSPIEILIQRIARLPGLGPRSARRVALHLLQHKDTQLTPLIEELQTAQRCIQTCPTCGNLDTQAPCAICTDPKRDPTTICVIKDVSDLWAIDRTGGYRGQYHVLGGHLSAIDGIGPENLTFAQLDHRLQRGTVREVIIALSPTLDGQTTAHYLTSYIQRHPVTVTQLAQGIPIGSDLDYLDEGTIQLAFTGRKGLTDAA